MKYEVICTVCGDRYWIRGSYDPETNATELDDNDDTWTEVCEHVAAGDYEIGADEVDDEPDEPHRDEFDPGIPKPGM